MYESRAFLSPWYPLILTCVTSAAIAQAPASTYTATMKFDVASVRESKPDMQHGFTVSGGFSGNTCSLHVVNFSLMNLVVLAYPVHFKQIENVPRELAWAVFTVDAKCDPATDQKLAALNPEQRQLERQYMMQVLLAERFNFKMHWETRDSLTYDLVVSKPGRLQSTGAPPTSEDMKWSGGRPVPPIYQRGDSRTGFHYTAHGATTQDIADTLTVQFGAPVTDKTGLTGKYDFDLKTYQTWARDRADDETNILPPLETAIQDQLGLKIVRSHGSVPFLIVDQIERPNEN